MKVFGGLFGTNQPAGSVFFLERRGARAGAVVFFTAAHAHTHTGVGGVGGI